MNIKNLGDFNIDLLKCDSNENVSDFLDIVLYSTNLLPNITYPTRLTSQSQTLIDNIFSSIINDDCIAGNLISPISDHHAQFLIIPNSQQHKIQRTASINEILSILVITNLLQI